MPGYLVIDQQYEEFRKALPKMVKALGFTMDNLPYGEYKSIVEETVLDQIGAK